MKMISRKIDGYLINLIQLGRVLEKLRWTGPTFKVVTVVAEYLKTFLKSFHTVC